jgi:hypothetical protein
MSDRDTTGKARGRRLSRPVVALIVLVALLAAIVYVTYPSVLTLFIGDAEVDTLRVENRTDETLLVYSKYPDGSEHRLDRLVPPIPPQTTVQTEAPCAATELVARTENGDLVAKRGPFEKCNLEKWVIEAGSG